MFAGGAAVASTSSATAMLQQQQVEGEDSSSGQGEEQPEVQAFDRETKGQSEQESVVQSDPLTLSVLKGCLISGVHMKQIEWCARAGETESIEESSEARMAARESPESEATLHVAEEEHDDPEELIPKRAVFPLYITSSCTPPLLKYDCSC
ncbi:hypothetical protein ABVT39_013353 [Epinephelus coioides]